MANILKLLFAGGLIYWLIVSGHLDLTEVSHILRPQTMILCLFIMGIHLLCVVGRWYFLLHAKDFKVKYTEVAKLNLIGVFFNFVVPSSVGGDVVKAFYVAKENPQRKLDAVATILMDRVLGLYSLIALSVVTVFINFDKVTSNPELQALSVSILILFSAMTTVIAMAFSEKIRTNATLNRILEKVPGGSMVQKLYAAFSAYQSATWLIVKVIIVSVFAHGLSISLFILVGHWLGATNIGLAAYFFCVPVAMVLTAVPLAPAGIGVGQVAMLALFKIYTGTETTVGQTAITVFQLTMLTWGMLGALFYVQRGMKIKELKAVE